MDATLSRKLKAFGSLTCVLAGLGPQAAFADFYLHRWENQNQSKGVLSLEPEVGFFSTGNNFDFDSTRFIPAGFAGYSRIQSTVTAAYGFHPYLTFFGRAGWARIQVEQSSGTGLVYGLTDQTLGLNSRVIHSPGFQLDLQFQTDLPAYNNNSAATLNTPYLGDGSVDFTGGAFAVIPIGSESRNNRWSTTVGAGYTWRSAGFSQQIPWSVAIRYQPLEDGFFFRAGVAGTWTLGTDPRPISSTGTAGSGAGGSYMVNAINPSLLAPFGRVGYQLARQVGFYASTSYGVWGTNSPQGLGVMIGMQARWGDEVKGLRPSQQSPREYGKANQGFVSYSFEARVIQSSERLGQIKINRGLQEGVALGQVFDIFLVTPDGTVGEAVARARCVSANSGDAVLSVTEFYKEVWIEEGFIVKRPLR